MSVYDVGDGVRISVTFRDPVGGALVDPASVEFRFKTPDGTETTYTYPADITRTSAGNYHRDVVLAANGAHYYRWASSGTYPSAAEGLFVVSRSHFALPQ